MPERRQAFAREPIVVGLTEDWEVSVGPIPWERRSEFGDEVIRQNVAAINEAVQIFIDPSTSVPQLEARMAEKFSDPATLLRIGLPEGLWDEIKTRPLYQNQIVELLLAIVDVNELHQLRPLLDPNSQTPTALTGAISELLAGMTDTGQQIESGPDSSSEDSSTDTSSSSPTQNSDPS